MRPEHHPVSQSADPSPLASLRCAMHCWLCRDELQSWSLHSVDSFCSKALLAVPFWPGFPPKEPCVWARVDYLCLYGYPENL